MKETKVAPAQATTLMLPKQGKVTFYIMNKKITPKKFSLIIEELVLTKRLTHLEAIIYYCEKNNLEAHTITKWMDRTMREKIQSNAEDLNYLPKSSSLF